MALRWGGGGTQKGRQSAEEHESSDREIPMESLQMDRLGQIIVICFLITTDAGGWRGETRIKEEEKKKERNTSFQPPKLQRTDCSKGEKINLLKIPPHPLFLTLHVSIPPIRTHTHTHTHHLFLSAYISSSTQASWTQEVQEWEESGSWGHSRVSNRWWGGLDMDAWDCACVWVCACVCM